MDMTWGSTTTAIAGSLHSLAILSTLFRLWCRWPVASMWWDDAWAVVALFADMASLVSVILEQPIPGTMHPRFSTIGQWIGSCAFPTIMWTTRLSILASMVRVSQPDVMLKRVAICIGLAFGAQWICMITLRLDTCIFTSCRITITIAIVQTATDCLADILLTALPIIFLRDVKLSRKSKILILSTFSASMVINVVTIVHAIFLFKPFTSTSIIVAHVKSALSVIVCNLLVIVTFIYRILHRGQTGLEEYDAVKGCVELTIVELSQAVWSQGTSSEGASFPVRLSGTMRSSTWSFKSPSPLASNLSSVVTETSRVETIQEDIIQEER